MFTIQVVRKSSGKPVPGTKVVVDIFGFRGYATEYTNQNGDAHFNCDIGEGDVMAEGMTDKSVRLQGRYVMYV